MKGSSLASEVGDHEEATPEVLAAVKAAMAGLTMPSSAFGSR
jgi:hypothetical protein